MNALNALFFDLLADRYDAEKRLVLAMPAMAKTSTSRDFHQLIQRHFRETIAHTKKLEMVFKSFGAEVKAGKCEATIGLLKECDEMAAEYKGSPALNAALISCAQKIEHFEIASYGCLAEWAAVLGNKEASSLLREILSEEKAADQALTFLARFSANDEAIGKSKVKGSQASGQIRKPVTRLAGRRPRTFNRIHPVLM
jgi:ferritin-like metal-binding protein YciE